MTAFISLHHISKAFGDQAVLKDINLELSPGTVTALIGESGCGKTTLLRLIAGLDSPDTGEIRQPHPLRLGVVFQEPRLFPWLTVEENVALAVRHLEKEEKLQATADALTLVGLDTSAQRYPDQLSGGMAQRVGLARALVGRPDLLLMDEAFSALDALTRERVIRRFEAIRETMPVTTLMVTHDIREAARLADQLCWLEDGRIRHTYPNPITPPRDPASESFNHFSNQVLSDFFHS